MAHKKGQGSLQPGQSSSGSAEQNSSPAPMSVWEGTIHYSQPQMAQSASRAEKSTSSDKQ